MLQNAIELLWKQKHGHKRKTATPSPPPPHGEMVPQMRKKALILYGENGNSKGEKHPTLIFFFKSGDRDPTCLSPLARPWAKVIIKLTIFSEIIHHVIMSKYTLECTQVHYFKKNSRESISSNPLAMKLNSVIRTARQRNRDILQYLHILSQNYPPCLNIDFYPLYPPPPNNNRICDHNAMLAFPQEKISHYTTGGGARPPCPPPPQYANAGTVVFMQV